MYDGVVQAAPVVIAVAGEQVTADVSVTGAVSALAGGTGPSGSELRVL